MFEILNDSAQSVCLVQFWEYGSVAVFTKTFFLFHQSSGFNGFISLLCLVSVDPFGMFLLSYFVFNMLTLFLVLGSLICHSM